MIQVEVGEGLSGEEKREVKSEILRIMKEASHSLKQSLPLLARRRKRNIFPSM